MEIKIITDFDEQFDMQQLIVPSTIPFFNPDMIGMRTYIVAQEGINILGIVSLVEETHWVSNAIGIGYISTNVNYRKQGVCSALVKAVFQYAKSQHKNISNTDYEPDGELYLRHVMQRTAQQFPEVHLFERADIR